MGAVSLTSPEAWIVVVAMLGQCYLGCKRMTRGDISFLTAMWKPPGMDVENILYELQQMLLWLIWTIAGNK